MNINGKNKFYRWLLDNIHSYYYDEWRFLMAIKLYEEEIMKLDKKQKDAIKLFVKLLESEVFYNGSGPHIRLKSIQRVCKRITHKDFDPDNLKKNV